MPDVMLETALPNVASATRHSSSVGKRISTSIYPMDPLEDMLYRKAAPVTGKECQKSLVLHYYG